jgi:hypothetical protein
MLRTRSYSKANRRRVRFPKIETKYVHHLKKANLAVGRYLPPAAAQYATQYACNPSISKAVMFATDSIDEKSGSGSTLDGLAATFCI